MIFNWDATQFVVSEEADTKVVVVKAEHVKDRPLTTEGNGGLDFAVKLYHLHHADGLCASPVFVIADDSMSSEGFDHDIVPRLSHENHMEAFGYLCFCPTRACNITFYRWFVNTVIIPFVLKTRAFYRSAYPDGSPMRAFLTCDGEAKQIEVFQEMEVISAMSTAVVDLGKTPASCSAICQASDASPFFRQAKKHLKHHQSASGVQPPKIMMDKLREMVNARAGFSDAKKRQIIESLKKIQFTIHKILTADYVKAGYEKIGQYPINFDRAMTQCSLRSAMDIEHMRSQWPVLAANFRTNGVLTEKDMDDCGIVKIADLDAELADGPTALPKDQRVLHRQRAVLMNSAACINFYRKYHEEKAAGTKPKRGNTATAAEKKLRARQKLAYQKWMFTTLSEEELRRELALQKKKGVGIKGRADEMWETTKHFVDDFVEEA